MSRGPARKRRPTNVVHFRRRRPRNRWSSSFNRRSRARSRNVAALAALGLAVGAFGGLSLTHLPKSKTSAVAEIAELPMECSSVDVIDGDTFKCDGERIRMQGIDAPEMPGHCRPGRECTPGDPYASTAHLSGLVGNETVRCKPTDTDSYGRTVARCFAGSTDLSCAQVESGNAVLRYAPIFC